MRNIPKFDLDRFKAVAIGSSTGGPSLVEQILRGLPADLTVPILIAQHMPPKFTESFAAQLAQISPLTVVHAQDLMPVYSGTVYIGQGHQHLRVKRLGRHRVEVEISPTPTELAYKPSVDELFLSCADVYGPDTLAIILSGIGRDGTQGAQAIRAKGGVVLTQSIETCAVYGMPRYCVEAGASDAQLPPDQIRRAILQLSPQYAGNAATKPSQDKV